MTVHAFVSGPGVWIAFGVFAAGLVVQGFRFFRLTRAKERLVLPAKPKKKAKKKKGKKGLGDKAKPKKPGREGMWIQRLLWWFEKKLWPLSEYANRKLYNMRFSMVGRHPVMTGVTVVFHVFLFAIPVFLLAHNELLRGSVLGFGLPSLSNATTDMMTILFLLCAGFFLARRMFVRRVRAITSAYDYLVWLVTVAPFLTGFFAYHHWFDYDTVILLHIISGEAMLILIPFTKLGHMVYFFLYRLFIGSEYSFGQGRRAW